VASPTLLSASARGGALKPRVETHPPYVETYGPEAIELSRRAGQELDCWQCDGVMLLLATRADGKWACFEYAEWVARQNGKGGILEARVLAGFLLLGEQLILWSAHEYKTSMEAFRRVKALLVALGRSINENLIAIGDTLIKVHNANGEEGFERLDTRQRIKFVARSKGSGRGFSGDLVILDEAFALTTVQHEALLPTLSARPNPQVIYTSSPPLSADSGDVMYLLRQRGDPTAPRDDNDPPWTQDDSLGYRDWGIGGDLDHLDEVDISDPDLAAASNPALGIRITMETVRRELRSMSAQGFARERLGVWPFRILSATSAWAVIRKADWLAAADPNSDRPSPVAFAVTLSTDRKWATISAAGPRPDGLILIHVVDRREGTGWVVERLQELIARWSPVAVVIDKGSPAGSIATEAEEAGIELTPIQTRDVAAAAGALYDGVAGRPAVDPATGELGRDPRVVRHRDQPELNTAVAAAAKRNLSTAWAWDQLAAVVDIAPLIGCSNALWGYTTRAAGPLPFFFARR